MPIAMTQEQQALQASLRDWAKRTNPIALVRALEPDGIPSGLAPLIPLDGGTVTDLAAALEQLACALAPGPVLPTALASLLLTRCGQQKLLPALAQAQATACVALAPGTLTGTRQADGALRVTGETGPVLWAAGHLFAPAASPAASPSAGGTDGDVWFLLEAGQPGVTVESLTPLDFSRELAAVRLADVVIPPENLLPGLRTERVAMGSGQDEAVQKLLAADGAVKSDYAERTGVHVATGQAVALLEQRGAHPAIRKLIGTAHRQAVAETALELLGPAGAAEGEASYEFLLTRCLSIAVPETTVLLTEMGRHASADSVKALATLMTGALPVARWGSADLQQALLPGVASGELTLTAAIREPSHPAPAIPATTVTDGKITDTKVGVPFADQSHRLLVPVRLAPAPDSMIVRSSGQIVSRTAHDHGVAPTGVVLVAPGAPGVRLTRTPSSSGQPEFTLRLDEAPVESVLGAAECVQDLYHLAVAGACALIDGAVAGALGLTRDHVATREQFGRPLAAFQAVSQQIADTYIASRTLHLATLSACWRLGESCDPGPTLQEHGTAWQQDFFLPKILAGQVHFAIGYTEPEAGTDLAALRTRAVRDGDDYVVDGQKIFTTGAHEADYIWLACRTGPPRHKGISILIVDTADPGFSWTPIITLDGAHHVNATYYSGVRVPDRMRVGAENEGWRLITTQLNHERVMLGPAGRIAALHDRVRAWAAERSLLSEPDVRQALARASAVMRVNELLNWQVAAAPVAEIADASATKVFSSKQLQVTSAS